VEECKNDAHTCNEKLYIYHPIFEKFTQLYDPKVKPTEIDVNEMALVHDPEAEAAKYYKDDAPSCCYG